MTNKTFLLLTVITMMILTGADAAQAQGKLNTGVDTPVQKGGPYDRVYNPENTPAPGDGSAFPQEWLHAYGSSEHNAAYTVPANAPAWLRHGVSWSFAEARAWALDKQPYAGEAIGIAGSDTTMTQWSGNAVGVIAVDGVIYAQSDDQFVYAVNARTGKLIWRTSPVGTTFMGQPLVQGDIVYVNAGTVGFNFSNLQAFGKTGKAVRGSGVEFNGIYALNRHTGELLWHFDTKGDVMPTPVIGGGRLVFPTGAGEVFALDAKTGEQLWVNKVGGMGNMSSPLIDRDKVYVGMSVPALLFCLDAKTGKTLWKGQIPQAANTGMGDVSPAVSGGIVIMDAVTAAQTVKGKTTMNSAVRAFDAETGKPLWTHQMGRGPKPPSFKGGVPLIHDGIVYIGTPVTSVYQALDLKTGKLLWSWKVPNPGPAGAARGPATFYDGALYIATVDTVYALNPKTGTLLGKKLIGGRFGIVSPTIVGGTIYLGNSWDWIIAVPVSEVNPKYVSGLGGNSDNPVDETNVTAPVQLSAMSDEQKKQEQQYFAEHSFGFSALFKKYHPGPHWILANKERFKLTDEQIKQQQELNFGMAKATISGNTALKKAYEKYALDAALAEPSPETLKDDIEAIGKAQTGLAMVMIPYHLKSYALLNPSQQATYRTLAAQQ